jgi:hypothetical protein
MNIHGPALLAGPLSKRKRDWKGRTDATIRHDLVARIRREIAAGTYDTPEKLEAALAILLERLDQE